MGTSPQAPEAPAAEPYGSAPWWDRLAALLFLAWLALVLATFRDYGITYDEEWRLGYGELVVRWYESGFRDRAALSAWTLVNEGAPFATLVALLARVLPLDLYETGHLLGGLWGLVAGLGTWAVARRVAGPPAGLLAAALLLTTPRFYGHSFANPGDAPFATLSILSLACLAPWLLGLPQPPWPRTLALGAALGAALAARIGGLVLLAPLALGVPLVHGLGLAPLRGRRALARVALSLVLLGAVAGVVALLTWPAAQVEPLRRPWRALHYGTRFQQSFDVLFAGETVANVDLPRTYVLRWFLLTLPETLLAALAAGVVVLLARLRGARRAGARAGGAPPAATLEVLLLLASVLLPLGYVVALHFAEYDGLRHYLFVVPSLCALGGIGLAAAFRRLASAAARAALATLLAAAAALVVADAVRLHPYQATTYFNRLVAGGLPGAAGRYETEYWGASFKEGVEWVQAHVPPGTADDPVTIGSALHPRSTEHYVRAPGFRYVGSVDHGDFQRPDVYLAPGRWGRNEAFHGELLHVVERMGVPLLWIVRVPRFHAGPAVAPGTSTGAEGEGEGR